MGYSSLKLDKTIEKVKNILSEVYYWAAVCRYETIRIHSLNIYDVIDGSYISLQDTAKLMKRLINKCPSKMKNNLYEVSMYIHRLYGKAEEERNRKSNTFTSHIRVETYGRKIQESIEYTEYILHDKKEIFLGLEDIEYLGTELFIANKENSIAIIDKILKTIQNTSASNSPFIKQIADICEETLGKTEFSSEEIAGMILTCIRKYNYVHVSQQYFKAGEPKKYTKEIPFELFELMKKYFSSYESLNENNYEIASNIRRLVYRLLREDNDTRLWGILYWLLPQMANRQCENDKIEQKTSFNESKYGLKCLFNEFAQKYLDYKNLLEKHPLINKEWSTKNKTSLYDHYMSNKNEEAVWECLECKGTYLATIDDYEEYGCPYHKMIEETANPEILYSYYLRKIFPSLINKYSMEQFGKYVISIFIPELDLAVEYDNNKNHKALERALRDTEKTKLCNDYGITIIRIRYWTLEDIPGAVNIKDEGLIKTLKKITDQIRTHFQISCPDIPVCYDDVQKIKEYKKEYEKEISFGTRYPELLDEFMQEDNIGVDPYTILPGSGVKVKWTCNNCGYKWESKVYKRAKEQKGCPCCKSSKGEKEVASFLKKLKVPFIQENIFPGRGWLRDDFALLGKEGRVLGTIEYNGEQHYFPVDFAGEGMNIAERKYKKAKERDKKKTDWLLSHNIPQLIIPYWDYDRIPELVKSFCEELSLTA